MKRYHATNVAVMLTGIALIVVQLLFPRSGVVLRHGLAPGGMLVLLVGTSHNYCTGIELVLSLAILALVLFSRLLSTTRASPAPFEVVALACFAVLTAIAVVRNLRNRGTVQS
jgi:membrane-bound ClpP family serine protease